MHDKKAHKFRIERQLIPRLKLLGVLLLFFGLCSFVYGLFVHTLSPEETPELASTQNNSIELFEMSEAGIDDILPEDALNFFFVALVFSSVGLGCVFISWKKRHSLAHKDPL